MIYLPGNRIGFPAVQGQDAFTAAGESECAVVIKMVAGEP
jgi:hypothetical protein